MERRKGEKKLGAELLRQDGVECHVDGMGKHRESVEVESGCERGGQTHRVIEVIVKIVT